MSDEIKIIESNFGKCEGQDVKRFTIKNNNDFEVNLISYGASIQSIKLKDKNGKLINLVLGLDHLEGLIHFFSLKDKIFLSYFK